MRGLIGELIGTFLLVFIGCGSVGWTLFVQPLDLWQIALVWGTGVVLAIWAASPFSSSHLNPAVSIGFLVLKKISRKEVVIYFIGQFLGAILAGIALQHIFIGYVDAFNVDSAMMYGEFYPNPGNTDLTHLTTFSAFSLECLGTFALMLGILKITQMKFEQSRILHPLFIGLLLATLIYFIAPYTQAGFNPARDFGPRLVSHFSGWDMAFSYNSFGWLTVYICGPILGATMAASFHRKSNLRKMMTVKG